MEQTDNKKLIVLRGVPGSGKTHLALEIIKQHPSGKIFSTDDFFVDPQTGQYNYNVKSIVKAHTWNQLRAEVSFNYYHSALFIPHIFLLLGSHQKWRFTYYNRQHKLECTGCSSLR